MRNEDLWVADASLMINLLGTGEPIAVLERLPGKLLAPPQTLKEVRKCPIEGVPKDGLLLPLLEGGYLEQIEMTDDALDIFMELVGAQPPDDLDDGEAAVIACAVTLGVGAIIDESKGQRICRERFPSLRIWSSCDLFRYLVEEIRVEAEIVRRWLRAARSKAKMKIPFRLKDWFLRMVPDLQAHQQVDR